jgi:outer membrane biosynthesis protein TonB
MACLRLVLALCILGSHVFGLHYSSVPGQRLKPSVSLAEDANQCKGAGIRLVGNGLRLRGGAREKDDEDSEEEAKWKGKAAKLEEKKAPVKAEPKEPEPVVQEPKPEPVVEKKEEITTESTEPKEAEEEVKEQKRPAVVSPELVQQMNEKLWEAAIDGNEPQVEKAIKGGANVNSFCRGP